MVRGDRRERRFDERSGGDRRFESRRFDERRSDDRRSDDAVSTIAGPGPSSGDRRFDERRSEIAGLVIGARVAVVSRMEKAASCGQVVRNELTSVLMNNPW